MSASNNTDILPEINELDVHRFLTESLYRRLPLALIASGGVALVTLLVMWKAANLVYLLIWSLTLLLTCLLRYAWYRQFMHSGSKPVERNWYVRYLIGIFLSGLVWAAFIWILPKGMSTEHWIFALFILGGMMAGGNSTSSAIVSSYLGFILPISISIIFWFFSSAAPFPISMSMLTILYTVILIAAAFHSSNSMRETYRLRFANTGLIDELTQEQQHSAELVEELKREVDRRANREEQLNDYNRLLQMLAHGEPLSVILSNLNIVAEKQLQEGISSIQVLDDQDKHITMISAPGLPESFTKSIQNQDIGMNTGSYTAAINDTTVVAENIATDPQWLHYRDLAQRHNLHSCWSSPVRNALGHVLGTLTIYHHKPYKPSVNDLEITMAMANIAGIAIEAKQTEQRLQNMAHYDQLTQLPNRAYLYDRLLFIITQAKRRAIRFALLFIDLDNFKEINDSLGHEAGDRLLQAVAKNLKLAVRDSDIVSRFGGDEFVILLTNLQETGDIDAVVKKILEHLMRPYQVDQQICQIGGSIGISLFPDNGQDADTLIQKADQAMYRAKEKGNHYTYYSDPNDLS